MKKPKSINTDRGKSTHCSVAVIADLLNLSVRRIQQLAERRIIPNSVRGKYDLFASVQGYADYLQSKIPSDEVIQHRKRMQEEKLRKLKLENDAAGEKVIDIDEVRAIVNEIYEVTKISTDPIADKLANEIAKTGEPALIKKMLLDEIRSAQGEISNYFRCLSGTDERY